MNNTAAHCLPKEKLAHQQMFPKYLSTIASVWTVGLLPPARLKSASRSIRCRCLASEQSKKGHTEMAASDYHVFNPRILPHLGKTAAWTPFPIYSRWDKIQH
jgi:hypothetical protein